MNTPDDNYLAELLDMEPILRAYLRRFSGSSSDLEDLVQEAYVRLLSVDTGERVAIRNVRAFALGIARNLAVDLVRRRRIVPFELVGDLDEVPMTGDAEQIEDIVHNHKELEAAEAAINALPHRCREVFSLRRVYGFSQKEIARRLGISENTVERHLVKGMRLFTEAFSSRNSAGPSSPAPRFSRLLGRVRSSGAKR